MSRRTLLLARWGIFLAACAFLYIRLAAGQSTHAAWADWRIALGKASWPLWAAMFAMAVLNWGIEAAKWRWLVKPLERLSLGRAFSATLAGTTIGLITPNRTGEFMGRVLFLAPENRWQGSFATILGSIAQFVATVAFGGLAFLVWWRSAAAVAGHGRVWGVAIAMLVAAVAGAALVLFFKPGLLRQLVLALPVMKRLDKATSVLEGYAASELVRVLGMSMARYAVFAFQFMLLLHELAVITWPQAMVVVPVIYLVTTLVPSMMLTDLGVRGSVAVALLAPAGGQAALVLLAAFAVWAVNLAMPAAAGALIILVARIRTRQ